MAKCNNKVLASAIAVGVGVAAYKRTHATCGKCGDKIYGKIHKIHAYGEVNRAAAELAGVNLRAAYCDDCYKELMSEFNLYKYRGNYKGVSTYSVNYRGNTHTDDANGVYYTTDSYSEQYEAKRAIRQVAAVYGCDAVTHLETDQDSSGQWTASGIICDFK